MAILNPQIQEQDIPNYMGFSKAITQPEFKSTAGEALKDVGKLGESALKVTENVAEQMYSQDAEKNLAPIQQQYLADLEHDYNLIKYQPTQTIGSSTAALGPDIIGPKQPDSETNQGLQTDIKEMTDGLRTLVAARAKGLSQTDYLGRVDKMMAEIRSRHPFANRDFIDTEADKILNRGKANERIKSLIGDINSFMTNQNAERTKALDLLKQYPADGWEKIYQSIQSGGDPSQAVRFVAPYATKKWKLEQQDLEMKNDKMGRDRQVDLAKIGVNDRIDAKIEETINGVLTGMVDSNGQPVTDAKQIADIAEGYRTGRIPLNTKNAENLAKLSLALGDRARNALWTDLSKGGHTALAGADYVKTQLDARMGFFKQLHDAFLDPNTGAAFELIRQIKDKQTASEYHVLNGPEGDTISKGKVLKDYGVDPAMYKKEFELKLANGWARHVFENATLDATTPKGDLRSRKSYDDFNTFLKGAKDLRNNPALPGKDFDIPRGIDGVVNLTRRFTDPKTPDAVKEQMADWFFNPNNNGALRNIGMGVKGGREAIFARFSQPDIAEAVYKMGGKPWAYYQDFMKTSFEKDVGAPLVQRLLDPVLQTMGTDASPIHLKYDDQAQRFDLIPTNVSSSKLRAQGVKAGSVDPMKSDLGQAIEHLNGVLHSYRNVALTAKQDPNEFVLQAIQDALGDRGDVTTIQGVLPNMVKAILATKLENQQAQKKMEEERKKYPGLK